MHTFQPIPVDMLNMNPFTKIGKEWALLTLEAMLKVAKVIRLSIL